MFMLCRCGRQHGISCSPDALSGLLALCTFETNEVMLDTDSGSHLTVDRLPVIVLLLP